jgi:hypothetical protein
LPGRCVGNKLGEGASLAGQFSRFTQLVHLGLEQNSMKELPVRAEPACPARPPAHCPPSLASSLTHLVAQATLLSGLKALKVVYLSHNEIAS